MNNWIAVHAGEWPKDQPCWLTIEHSDGGHTVWSSLKCDQWASMRVIAYMPCEIPEPFQGPCLPFSPQQLSRWIAAGDSIGDMAARVKMEYQRFIASCRRYPELKAIWDARYDV
jgi:hypothetical protein